jgi:signal transduction histidine kinase
MRVSDINPNFPVERWAEHYQEVKKRGSMRLETQQIAGDGQTHDIEVSANYFKFGDREFMCSFGRDITERKEVERALQESQKDLRKLAGKLISAQEAERRRLAREMHDDISQRLAVLAIDAGKLEGSRKDPEDPFLEMLQDMKERLVNLSSDIHAISRQLHPSIIDDLGLVDAVRAECEGFTRREGVKVKYTSEGVPTTIPKDVSICIYRIIQEGIRNIAKHAQTKDAHVSLSCKDDSVNLTIRDNGIGFDPLEAKKKPGLGLASMEERVRLIQGDISVKSQPGKGTVIEVRAPLTSS